MKEKIASPSRELVIAILEKNGITGTDAISAYSSFMHNLNMDTIRLYACLVSEIVELREALNVLAVGDKVKLAYSNVVYPDWETLNAKYSNGVIANIDEGVIAVKWSTAEGIPYDVTGELAKNLRKI